MDLGEGLEGVLAQANSCRYALRHCVEWSTSEAILDAIFRTSRHLAVYGTLAPGAPNHHLIKDLKGRWLDGVVRGELHEAGWGMSEGYPAMHWNPRSEEIPVKLLVSEDLPHYWQQLDEFEGQEYQRILIPVHQGESLLAVANIYEARTGGGES